MLDISQFREKALIDVIEEMAEGQMISREELLEVAHQNNRRHEDRPYHNAYPRQRKAKLAMVPASPKPRSGRGSGEVRPPTTEPSGALHQRREELAENTSDKRILCSLREFLETSSALFPRDFTPGDLAEELLKSDPSFRLDGPRAHRSSPRVRGCIEPSLTLNRSRQPARGQGGSWQPESLLGAVCED